MDEILLATKDCRYGRITYMRMDTYVGRSLELYGEWCEGEIILFRRLLHSGDVAIDVGANIGTHTLPLAKFVGPSGAVHAFEPQQAIYEILSTNVRANGLLNVRTYMAAVGALDGFCRIPQIDYKIPNNFSAVAIGQGSVEVPMVTIDGLDLPKVSLIKIDVEGGEAEVLKGATSTLSRHRPLLYVENNQLEKSKALVSLIRGLGYRMWWHISVYYNPLNFAGNLQNVWPNNAEPNMICLPQDFEVPPWPLKEVHDGSELSDVYRLLIE